jgi:hypothetical protein
MIVCVCVYVCTSMYVCMHAYICICKDGWIDVCADVRLVSAWNVAKVLFIIGVQECSHHRSVPVLNKHYIMKTYGEIDA